VSGRDLGRLAPGGPADVLILDDRLDLRAVFVGGKERIAA
jgi:N-acetylglucosamine-6-phosphate deacetylase